MEHKGHLQQRSIHDTEMTDPSDFTFSMPKDCITQKSTQTESVDFNASIFLDEV